jgi:hypothetical protein
MSKINKLTQLIIKITHRTEQTDDETSACQENINESSSKNIKPKISLLQKRLLWCFVVIILLIGGYFWWRMPARMRVVAVIPREINDRVWYTPIGLYCLSQPSLSHSYPILTLYGWDGKECWSKQLRENNNDPKVSKWNLACSPDGHYVAVIVIEKNKIHILSWCDGKSVSDSYLDYENKIKLNTQSIYLEITTSGKIWVYYNNSKDFTLKIIDGIKIASCKLPFDNYKRYFSPENDTIVNLTKNGIYVVSSINIKNTKILPTIVASKRLSSYSVELSKIIFHDDKYNMYIQNGKGFIKTTYKADGYAIIRGTNNNLLVFREHDAVNENNLHLLNIKTMKEWNIPVKQNLTKVLYGTQDGKHVLLCESNYHKELEHLYLFLLKYLKLNQNQEYKLCRA